MSTSATPALPPFPWHCDGLAYIQHATFSNSYGPAYIECYYNANKDNIRFVVPHQANIRIIEAVAKRLELTMDKVMVNIEHFGNTSAATIPLALWENESKLKKGDNLILTAFGAGFVHGASYLKPWLLPLSLLLNMLSRLVINFSSKE